MVAGPLFTVAAVVLFLAGQLVPGLLLLAAGLVIIGWSRTVAGMCSRTFKEAEEKLLELARRAGIQAIGTADELVKLLESQLARQAEEMSKALEKRNWSAGSRRILMDLFRKGFSERN